MSRRSFQKGAVAGACVTILQAWFGESFVIPNPVVPNAAGTDLLDHEGPSWTVGNELNELVANVATGRNDVGIRYRTDYTESLKLGEAVALDILEENKACYNELAAFNLTKLDGTTLTI